MVELVVVGALDVFFIFYSGIYYFIVLKAKIYSLLQHMCR